MKRVFVFDESKCCACSACMIGCMDQNDVDPAAGDPCFRRTFDEELDVEGGQVYCAYLSAACMHCDDAPCIAACPVGCLKRIRKPVSQSTITPTASAAKAALWPAPLGRPDTAPPTGKW